MEKKRLRDVIGCRVMSFKEATKSLNWNLIAINDDSYQDELYIISCDCGNSEIEYNEGATGIQKIRCGNCGKQMSSLISLNPACRSMLDIEKDEEGNERFWTLKTRKIRQKR